MADEGLMKAWESDAGFQLLAKAFFGVETEAEDVAKELGLISKHGNHDQKKHNKHKGKKPLDGPDRVKGFKRDGQLSRAERSALGLGGAAVGLGAAALLGRQGQKKFDQAAMFGQLGNVGGADKLSEEASRSGLKWMSGAIGASAASVGASTYANVQSGKDFQNEVGDENQKIFGTRTPTKADRAEFKAKTLREKEQRRKKKTLELAAKCYTEAIAKGFSEERARFMAEEIAKHMIGRHDQSNHGRHQHKELRGKKSQAFGELQSASMKAEDGIAQYMQNKFEKLTGLNGDAIWELGPEAHAKFQEKYDAWLNDPKGGGKLQAEYEDARSKYKGKQSVYREPTGKEKVSRLDRALINRGKKKAVKKSADDLEEAQKGLRIVIESDDEPKKVEEPVFRDTEDDAADPWTDDYHEAVDITPEPLRPTHVTKRVENVTWTGEISKVNDEKKQVFGWASVAEVDGKPVVDLQGDMITPDEMERAAYDYNLNSQRIGGEMHARVGKSAPKHVSTMIESMVFTPEKIAKMGLPPGSLPTAWWVGYQIHDEEVWKGVKTGKYKGFSVHGVGKRTPVSDIQS